MKETTVVFLLNSIALICFTALAFLFDKWWIIFFALLFSYKYTSETKTDAKEDSSNVDSNKNCD